MDVLDVSLRKTSMEIWGGNIKIYKWWENLGQSVGLVGFPHLCKRLQELKMVPPWAPKKADYNQKKSI